MGFRLPALGFRIRVLQELSTHEGAEDAVRPFIALPKKRWWAGTGLRGSRTSVPAGIRVLQELSTHEGAEDAVRPFIALPKKLWRTGERISGPPLRFQPGLRSAGGRAGRSGHARRRAGVWELRRRQRARCDGLYWHRLLF